MFIAQTRAGRLEIVQSLGAKDPEERLVDAPAFTA
jgi:hypothetical protein